MIAIVLCLVGKLLDLVWNEYCKCKHDRNMDIIIAKKSEKRLKRVQKQMKGK